MRISSVRDVDPAADGFDAGLVVSELSGRRPSSVEILHGGRNNRLYKVACADSGLCVVKRYFSHRLDKRDRLGVEFAALRFLWGNGIRSIPRPIAADRNRGCAVYEFVDGERIPSEALAEADIDEALRFLVELKRLKNREGSSALPLASEACFSPQAIVDNIASRLKRLEKVRSNSEYSGELTDFLVRHFVPLFGEITAWAKSRFEELGRSFGSVLERRERTLSPSDFGFHNALRRRDGAIVFLDFEYFGWDDPAKMISDFLLHPDMELGVRLRRRFLSEMVLYFEDEKQLARRVEVVYPLFALKWCLILLNEFVPVHELRRRFANGRQTEAGDTAGVQLMKTLRMLEKVRSYPGRLERD